jgi:hypothetical protein
MPFFDVTANPQPLRARSVAECTAGLIRVLLGATAMLGSMGLILLRLS